MLDRSKLMCIRDDLAKLNSFLGKTDVIESSSRERINTKWRFYQLTYLTVFAALLKGVPMGCKDAVLPQPLHKKHTVNCLLSGENTKQPHKQNLCFFRGLALHLRGNERMEGKTSKIFNLFLSKMDALSPNQSNESI